MKANNRNMREKNWFIYLLLLLIFTRCNCLVFGNSFWVASLAYVAELSNLLVRLTAVGRELIVCLFFSIFYGLVNTSTCWEIIYVQNISHSLNVFLLLAFSKGYLWKRLVGGDYPHEYESIVLNKSVNDSNDPIYNPETMVDQKTLLVILWWKNN